MIAANLFKVSFLWARYSCRSIGKSKILIDVNGNATLARNIEFANALAMTVPTTKVREYKYIPLLMNLGIFYMRMNLKQTGKVLGNP